MGTTPAGWHPDPWFPGQLRHWNGSAWTNHTAPIRAHVPGRWPWNREPRPAKFKPSDALVDATYAMLREDRSMIVLLFVGSVLATTVGAAIAVPAVVWGQVDTSSSYGGSIVGMLVTAAVLGATTFVLQLVTGAVVAAALLRAEGEQPTMRRALAVAWTRRRQILAWAAVSTVVGLVIGTLQRLGIGGVLAALTANLGWAVATVFAMPVVIVEGTMPMATARRSAQILKDNFGATVFSNIRIALPWIVGTWVSAGVGLFGCMLLLVSIPLGVAVAAVGVTGFVFCLVVSSALSTYLRTYLYRYAAGLSVPGIDPQLLPPPAPR
jgi:MFS family permease